MDERIRLVCEPLTFYTENDEILLFEWLHKIRCITSIEGVGEALYLNIASKIIPDADLLDLMGVFNRYRFDSQQLRVFMNDANKGWFEAD